MERLLPGLRRADECVVCGVDLPAGATAWWDPRARAVTCAMCHEAQAESASAPSTPVEGDWGQPAASVAGEHQRRKAAREAEVRAGHPRVGGLLLKVSRAPQREAAFRSGEQGELAVGEMLNKRAAKGLLIALHDRRVPGRQGNIDHIAVAPTGVYVIDAKQYSGKVWGEDRGFRGARLMVNGRDRSKLLEGLGRQLAVVREALEASGHRDVLVQGVLCFTTGNLPRFKALRIGEYLVVDRRRLGKRLDADGPLAPAAIGVIGHALAAALPPKIVTASEP
jgi:Nuclease-related domain